MPKPKPLPTTLVFLLLAAAAPFLVTHDDVAWAGDGRDDPAAIFAGRCATCHAVPDTTLWMDRAWLDQVNRTT